jgi:hypothetical protein
MFKSITFEVIGDQKLVCEGCQERGEHLVKTLDGIGQVRATSVSRCCLTRRRWTPPRSRNA